MYCFPTRFLARLALGLLLSWGFSAGAQQTIIFSKPANLTANKANSFLPETEHRSGDYNAPRQFFNDYTPDLPAPKPLLNNNNASVKEALDRRKNWTLLTPEQILGIQTPEEILGLPDKTGRKKLSLEEQFLLRAGDSQLTLAATNSRAGNAYWRDRSEANPFADQNQNDENNPFRRSAQKLEPGAKYFNQLLNTAPEGAGPDGKPNSPWNTAFTQPTQPKATPEQLAEMERFRALLEPTTPPDKTTTTRFSVPPVAALDPYLQPVPVINPAGRSVPTLENVFSRPAGIKPLPGISTATPTPVATKSKWQAQLPPWLTDVPQTHNPNRNY